MRASTLLEKLDNSNIEIKKRAMANLLNKFKYGVISIPSSEDDEQLLVALLKWFNNNPCFYYRQVIQLVSEFAKRKTSASILIEVGAIGFFQTLRLYAPDDIHSDVDLIVEILKQERNEKENKVITQQEEMFVTQTRTDLHTSRFQKYSTNESIKESSTETPKKTTKRIELMESDKQYLFEINVKLQQRRIDIIQDALTDLKKSPLLEFPIECLVQSTDVIRSLVSLLQNDFGMAVDSHVLECLSTIFEKVSLKILDDSLEDIKIIDTDSLLYIFKYCYSKFVHVFKLKPSLLGRLVDTLKLILDCFLEQITSIDKLTLLENYTNIYEDLVNLLNEKNDVLDAFKILDLFSTLLSKTHINIEQIKRIDIEKFNDFNSLSEIENSYKALEDLMDDDDGKALPDAKAHLNRLFKILPLLPHFAGELCLERFIQELFITAEFLNDSCVEVLVELLSSTHKEIRTYVIKSIVEDQQVFFEKFDCDDIFYLISVHSMVCAESTLATMELVHNSPRSIRRFLPYLPLLQCSIKYSENIPSTETFDKIITTLQLFERVMTKEEVMAYHTRFLFHKFKWIRESACVNLKTLIISECKMEDIDIKEGDPFLSCYLEDTDRFFNESISNDIILESETDSLISLLRDSEDQLIIRSVADKLSSLLRFNHPHGSKIEKELVDVLIYRILERPLKELIVLLINIIDARPLFVIEKYSKFCIYLEIRKLSFILLSRIIFSKDVFIKTSERFSTKMVFETNEQSNPIPKVVSESFYTFPFNSLYNLECRSSIPAYSTKLVDFFKCKKNFSESSYCEEKGFEVLNEIYPKFFINNSLSKLSQSRSHGEFLTNLQILQDYLLLDDWCFNYFFESDWRRVFLKFLHKPPISKADDIVLENLINFFSKVAKKKTLEKDVISELSYCFCKNFVNILLPNQGLAVNDRSTLRACLLKFLDYCVLSLQDYGCMDELKLLLNEDLLIICLRGYTNKQAPYDLRVASLRCICRLGMSEKIFSSEILEILKSIFNEIVDILILEGNAFCEGISFGSHCIKICLHSLVSLSGLFKRYNVSWLEFAKEKETLIAFMYSKNIHIRETSFKVISNCLISKESLIILEELNPKIVELLMSKIISLENDFVKEQCVWVLCKVVSLTSPPLDFFLTSIPFPQLYTLSDRHLEASFSLIYQLIRLDPSSQSKVLFENSALNFFLKKLEEAATTGNMNAYALENLLKTVKLIIQNNNEISSYLLKDTTLIENLLKIVGNLLNITNSNNLIELAYGIMNNLISFANDSLSLEYLKNRENTLHIISVSLVSSPSRSVKVIVAKFLTTLIGRKCFPYNPQLGEHEQVMEIIEELQKLYFLLQDNFFVETNSEEIVVIGKALSWILNLYTRTKVYVQESIIENVCLFNRKILSSLSIDFLHVPKSGKSEGIEKFKHQTILNLSILQHVLLSNHAKKVSHEFKLIQDLKYIWFANFTDSDLRLSLLNVFRNMVAGCERNKLDLALDLNKHQKNSLISDFVNGSLSSKSKFSNSSSYFILLGSLINSNEVRYSMLKYGLFEKLVTGLKEIFIKKKDDIRMEYCLQFLAHSSFFEDCHEYLLQSDTIDHLFEQLEKSPNEILKEHIILIFRNLLFCKSNSTLILRANELCILVMKISVLLRKNRSITHYSANLLWTYLSLYVDGRNLLAKYEVKSDWSNCWKVAVNSMIQSCKEMKSNDDIRSKLAVHLTNCHLSKSGLKTYECDGYMSVAECTHDMVSSPIAFNAYTEFSTHVDQICFYIKAETFQKESERLVEQLVNETEKSLNEIQQLKEQSLSIKETLTVSEITQRKIMEEQGKFEKALSLMKKLELEFYESLKKEFSTINSMTKSLYMESQQISEEQSRTRQDINTGFNQIDQTNRKLLFSLEESIQHSTRIRQDQLHTIKMINSVNQKQEQMSEITVRAIQNQRKLMMGQKLLQSLQKNITKLTSQKLSTIEMYTSNIGLNIEISMKNQLQLLEKQKECEIFIENLKKDQAYLFKEAQQTLRTILINSQETVQNINEQHEHVREILEGIIGISHNYTTLIGEFMDFKSFLFYFFSVVLSLILTSSRYTSKARVELLLLITVNYIVEKIICVLIGDMSAILMLRNYSRTFSIAVGLFLLFRSIFFFKDYSHLAFQVVQDLRIDLQKQKRSYYMIKQGSTYKRSKNTFLVNPNLAAPVLR